MLCLNLCDYYETTVNVRVLLFKKETIEDNINIDVTTVFLGSVEVSSASKYVSSRIRSLLRMNCRWSLCSAYTISLFLTSCQSLECDGTKREPIETDCFGTAAMFWDLQDAIQGSG
jgi:hypothetical protein